MLRPVMAESNNTDPTGRMVGWYTEPTERGTLSLVYNCLVTIFACTWTVLHLNVPGRDDSTTTRFLRKTKWMAITILLPEFIFAKAVCELRLALKDYREIKETFATIDVNRISWDVLHWNKKHGFRMSWKVCESESKLMRILYRLMGLGQWKTHSEDKARDHKPTEAEPEKINRLPGNGATRDGTEERSTSPTLSIHLEDPSERLNQQDSPASGILETHSNAVHPSEAENGDTVSNPQSSNNDHTNKTNGQVETQWRNQDQVWTLTHSYLANMGGLVYWRGSGHSFVLTSSKLGRNFEWDSLFDHPLRGLSLNMEDITDKSKADWLLRSLSVMQISSFVLTVIARGSTSLPLTQLEIATLAFSIFAVATYLANWWKPKDLSHTIRIPHMTSGSDRSWKHEKNPTDNTGAFDCTQSFTRRLIAPNQTRKREEKSIQDVTRVRNDIVDMEGNIPIITILMAICSLVFGGLHCLAWYFEFPTGVELILWRVTSISSALIPLLSLLTSSVLTYLANSFVDSREISALVSEMKCLDAWPKEYLQMVIRLVFIPWLDSNEGQYGYPKNIGKMSLKEYCIPVTSIVYRPAGQRDFDRQPKEEEMQRVRDSEQQEKFYRIGLSMSEFACDFRYLLDLREKAIQGRRGRQLRINLKDVIWKLRRRKEGEMDIWKDFESSYVKKRISVPGKESLEKTAVGDLLTGLNQWQQKFDQLDRGRKHYDTASQVIMIGGGIFYIIARLILLGLLFTSLRLVPIGVYENTPWTRFIPSFS